MTTKDKRTIALNNPSFEIVIKYNNPLLSFGTGYSSELMDMLADKLRITADETIVTFLKEHHIEKENIIFRDNEPF